MILVAAGGLFLGLCFLRWLQFDENTERALSAVVAIVSLLGSALFGKALLATLERRSRAR